MRVVNNRVNELLARKEASEKRRITNKELAEDTGLNINTITSWRLNRVTRFDQDAIAAWCFYFDIGIEELLEVEAEKDDRIGTPASPALELAAA